MSGIRSPGRLPPWKCALKARRSEGRCRRTGGPPWMLATPGTMRGDRDTRAKHLLAAVGFDLALVPVRAALQPNCCRRLKNIRTAPRRALQQQKVERFAPERPSPPRSRPAPSASEQRWSTHRQGARGVGPPGRPGCGTPLQPRAHRATARSSLTGTRRRPFGVETGSSRQAQPTSRHVPAGWPPSIRLARRRSRAHRRSCTGCRERVA